MLLTLLFLFELNQIKITIFIGQFFFSTQLKSVKKIVNFPKNSKQKTFKTVYFFKKYMFSRSTIAKKYADFFDFDVLPEDLRDEAKRLVQLWQIDDIKNKSDRIRKVLNSDLVGLFKSLSDQKQSSFLKCSKAYFSLIKNGLIEPNLKQGRPTKLLSEGEQKVRKWLEEQSKNNIFPTKKDFNEICVSFLEEQKYDGSWSKNYFNVLINRIAPDFETRVAQALDNERGDLKEEDLKNYFQILKNLLIDQINPKLIINLDETGFGGSKAVKKRGKKVLVKKSYTGKCFYQAEKQVNLITALIAVTASGEMITPCCIVQRGTEHPDEAKCPFYNKMKVFTTPNAFITRSVFENYLNEYVLKHIEKVRTEIGNSSAPALIIYDGHKAHLSQVLFASCAEKNIHVVIIPPHSSHIVQTLDQGIFRSMKNDYASISDWPDVSKISQRLQRIFTVIERSQNHQLILRSWAKVGIMPIIENGDVHHVELVENAVLKNESVLNALSNKVNEKERGKKNDKADWGLMNEEQINRVNEGLCPFCGKKLSQDGDE